MKIIESIEAAAVVPVFFNGDAEVAKNVMRACYEGGIRAFEFTNRGAEAFEVFGELVSTAAADCPEMIVGIGSIVTAVDCARFVGAGARFVVGPVFSGEVMAESQALGVPYIPGAATPTEIFNAWRAGAEIVKVFPAAEAGGPSFVKAVRAPMPWLRIMVTGGVEPTETNLAAWFGAGVACVGMGSNLFPAEAIRTGDWERITELCRLSLAIAQQTKR